MLGPALRVHAVTLNNHSDTTSIFGGASLILLDFSRRGSGGIVTSQDDAVALLTAFLAFATSV